MDTIHWIMLIIAVGITVFILTDMHHIKKEEEFYIKNKHIGSNFDDFLKKEMKNGDISKR